MKKKSKKKRMNPVIKEQWLFLLESGAIDQCKDELYNNENKGSFCYLGVLCELARAHGIVSVTKHGEYYKRGDPNVFSNDSSFSELPYSVVQWAGLDKSEPTACRRSLISMNDKGKSFKEIAKVIRVGL